MDNMIDAVIAKDFNVAGKEFTQELNNRIMDALEAKRVEVGQAVFGSAYEDDEDDSYTDQLKF